MFCDNSTAVAYVNNMGADRVPELHSLFLLGTLLVGSGWSGFSSEKSGSDSADVKGYFIVGE